MIEIINETKTIENIVENLEQKNEKEVLKELSRIRKNNYNQLYYIRKKLEKDKFTPTEKKIMKKELQKLEKNYAETQKSISTVKKYSDNLNSKRLEQALNRLNIKELKRIFKNKKYFETKINETFIQRIVDKFNGLTFYSNKYGSVSDVETIFDLIQDRLDKYSNLIGSYDFLNMCYLKFHEKCEWDYAKIQSGDELLAMASVTDDLSERLEEYGNELPKDIAETVIEAIEDFRNSIGIY